MRTHVQCYLAALCCRYVTFCLFLVANSHSGATCAFESPRSLPRFQQTRSSSHAEVSTSGNVTKEPCPSSPLGYCSAQHGKCAGQSCLCDPGWVGEACDVRDISVCDPSANSGHAIAAVSTQVPLSAFACSGHGVCAHGACACDVGFTGKQCEVAASCPNNCHNRGVCHQGNCFCAPGFGGESCLPIGMVAMTLNHNSSKRDQVVQGLGSSNLFSQQGRMSPFIVGLAVTLGLFFVSVLILVARRFQQRRNLQTTDAESPQSGHFRVPSPIHSPSEARWWR